MILDFLFRHKRGGFYVDVWANHPSRLSNTYFFYKSRWWHGINIEPNPALIKNFFLRKRDTNLNIGIAPQSGEMNFYEIHPDTLSTFNKSSAEDYIKQWHPLKKEYMIPVKPLSQVLSECSIGIDIDFFSVDTEGFDMEVLKSNDWNRFRPKAIVLETIEYKKDGWWDKLTSFFETYLKEQKYKIYADTHINTIFISEEYAQEISV